MATDLSAVVPPVLHLVTPQSQGKPLCGESAPDAAIGTYCEQLDGGRWIVEVRGKDGKAGNPCKICFSRYPSMLIRKPRRDYEDGWPFFMMLAKVHVLAIVGPLLVWLIFRLCQWLAQAPYPPRIP